MEGGGKGRIMSNMILLDFEKRERNTFLKQRGRGIRGKIVLGKGGYFDS